MKNIITITSNRENDFNIQEMEINQKEIAQAINFREFDEIQKLTIIIAARAKASQMWASGVAKVEVSYSI